MSVESVQNFFQLFLSTPPRPICPNSQVAVRGCRVFFQLFFDTVHNFITTLSIIFD